MSNELQPPATPNESNDPSRPYDNTPYTQTEVSNTVTQDTSNENHGKLITQLAQRIRVLCTSCKSVFFKAPHEIDSHAFYCEHNPKCISEGQRARAREIHKADVLASRDPADNSEIIYPDELQNDAEKVQAANRAKAAAPIEDPKPAEEPEVTPSAESAESAYEDEGGISSSSEVPPSGHEEPNGEFHY
jgi:hypothetical protein